MYISVTVSNMDVTLKPEISCQLHKPIQECAHACPVFTPSLFHSIAVYKIEEKTKHKGACKNIPRISHTLAYTASYTLYKYCMIYKGVDCFCMLLCALFFLVFYTLLSNKIMKDWTLFTSLWSLNKNKASAKIIFNHLCMFCCTKCIQYCSRHIISFKSG